MSNKIQTHCGNIELITTDPYTGEGTGDIRLEIETKYCSAWIDLEYNQVKQLRDELNDWLDDN